MKRPGSDSFKNCRLNICELEVQSNKAISRSKRVLP